LNEPSEQDDLARSLLGDGEAYSRIIARHQVAIARRLRAFERQPRIIEELVQEVFVEAYHGLAGFRADGEFAAWLGRIATRIGYRYWKRRAREPVVRNAEWWRELPAAPGKELTPSRAAEVVQALLERLPPRDRLVLLLLYVEGHPIPEAAKILGWSQTMIRVQAFRARTKLSSLLAKAGISNIADLVDFQRDDGMREVPVPPNAADSEVSIERS
jgi:RNA polymerase sigma-70 factor, ECF subfamily